MAGENEDWFNDNAPGSGAPTSGGGSSFGNPAYDRVAAIYRRALGREPTRAEVTQFGTNIDDRYLQEIERTIYRSPEAEAYARRQQNGGSPSHSGAGATANPPTGGITGQGGTGGGPDMSDPRTWTPESLQAYYESRGGQGPWSEIGYWMSKRQELYDRGQQIGDSGYGLMRLSKADSITPADQRYDAGSGSGLGEGDLLKPFTEQFTYADFVAPTEGDLQKDSGFQASINRARDMVERSAAAKGSLGSANTLADISDRTASMTQDAYQNLFGRRMTEYGTNRQNAFEQYNERRRNFYQNQDSPFAKLLAMSQLESSNNNYMAGLAAQYAGLGANIIRGGSDRANDYATGGSNAAAAGQVGSGNAYSSLFGGLAQLPWMVGSMRSGYQPSYRAPYMGTPNLYYWGR